MSNPQYPSPHGSGEYPPPGQQPHSQYSYGEYPPPPPNLPYAPPPPPLKKQSGNWIVYTVIAVGCFLAGSFFGGIVGANLPRSGTNSTSSPTGSATSTSSYNPSSPSTPSSDTSSPGTSSSSSTHHKIGEMVTVNGKWEITVNSAKTSAGDTYHTPKSGTVFLLIAVSMKNISNKEQNVSSLLMFKLRDTSGQAYNDSFSSGETPPEGKIEAGGPLKGTLSYEVPPGVKSFVLSFEPDILDNNNLTLFDIQA